MDTCKAHITILFDEETPEDSSYFLASKYGGPIGSNVAGHELHEISPPLENYTVEYRLDLEGEWRVDSTAYFGVVVRRWTR